MTPNSSGNLRQKLNLGKIKGREVIANFDGGRITSDAGIVLMADKNKKLTAWLDKGRKPPRPPRWKLRQDLPNVFKIIEITRDVDYPVHQLLAQRVYGIILGYEDVNDHEKLRYDPALPAFLTKSAYANDESLMKSRVEAYWG